MTMRVYLCLLAWQRFGLTAVQVAEIPDYLLVYMLGEMEA